MRIGVHRLQIERPAAAARGMLDQLDAMLTPRGYYEPADRAEVDRKLAVLAVNFRVDQIIIGVVILAVIVDAAAGRLAAAAVG